MGLFLSHNFIIVFNLLHFPHIVFCLFVCCFSAHFCFSLFWLFTFSYVSSHELFARIFRLHGIIFLFFLLFPLVLLFFPLLFFSHIFFSFPLWTFLRNPIFLLSLFLCLFFLLSFLFSSSLFLFLLFFKLFFSLYFFFPISIISSV